MTGAVPPLAGPVAPVASPGPAAADAGRSEHAAPRSLWHVSAFVDVAAYHFSWAWVLIPLLFLGEGHPVDYLLVFVVIMLANFSHRHFTLPYVYFDRQVFAQFPLRFIVFPAVMLAFFLASPLLWRAQVPLWPGGDPVALKHVVSTSAFVAVLWNLWHIHMQKFGILRLYNAKGMRRGDADVPRWVDWLLVFGWLPFYLVYIGPANRNLLIEHGPTIRSNALPLVDGMDRLQPWLLPPALLLVGASLVLFLGFEWKRHRLRNVPRLSLAAGLTMLSASFLVFHPVKVALAYVFTHAVEYMVFVGAFQRRRYARHLPHDPLLGRILRRPWLAYGGGLLLMGTIYFYCAYFGRYFWTEAGSVSIAGTSLRRWIFYWGIYQSMVHFYFDGFLWKMRLPVYRESI